MSRCLFLGFVLTGLLVPSTRLQASTIFAWGDPDNLRTSIPSDLTNAVSISCGSFGLALLQDLTVRNWGNEYGGSGPVPTGLANVTAIAAGSHHSLALKSDGTITA